MASSSGNSRTTTWLDFPIESSSNSTACFDLTVDYLDWFLKESDWNFERDFGMCGLKMEVGLLKTFVLCARKWRSKHFYLGHDEEGNISGRVQHLVSRIIKDIHSAACLTSDTDDDGVEGEINRYLENIMFLMAEIEELYTILVDDNCWWGYLDRLRLMDLIDALLMNLTDIWHVRWLFYEALYYLIETLPEKLIFLKNLISFAITQGVGHMQLRDLLINVEVVAVNAARLIYICWISRHNEQVCYAMQSEISQLIEMIKPVDPQVREIYVNVLTAAKLSTSSSSDILTVGNIWHRVAVGFIDSLLDNFMELLDSYTSFTLSVKDQMQKLHEGVRFLSILLSKRHEMFNELHDKMKDLIRVVVCDAGIVICSLSLNEMKEGLAEETGIAFFHLLRVLEFIMAEVAQIHPRTWSSFSFPRTNELGCIDFLLENLKELISCGADLMALPKDQIHAVQKDLVTLRSFLENIAEQRSQNEKLQHLWSRVMEVAYKAEFVIDSLMVGDNSECLDTIAQDIRLIKIEALEIYDSMRHDTNAQGATNTSNRMPSQVSIPTLYDVLVGLDDEVNIIIDRLTRGSKRMDIVSIVGMPGLGKTTLANKVHHDPLIMCHFHIRAWCTVSHMYSRQSLLHNILGDIVPGEYIEMKDNELAEKLYKHLKGNRYLIVLDDVWDLEAWNLLKGSFPNDDNGSRILLTSRFHNLCSQFKPDSKPHQLRPLTDEESWALLQNKLFGKEFCPPSLSVVGMQIAKSCKGLPLTIVIVAGILTSIEQDSWEEVATSLCSSTVMGTEHCMKTLELSYNNLPDYLKPCLLYFGAFQEDQDIPIQRLIYLWISEGFVQKTEEKSLEDVADDYLMDLIDRSLVMVTQKRSIGGVKACRIHDLLHEFCVAKAKEESFLQILYGYNESCSFTGPYKFQRLRICSAALDGVEKSRLFIPHLRSLLLFADVIFCIPEKYDYSFVFRKFKLLRVLDLGKIYLLGNFAREVEFLVHLRYLAICGVISCIPSPIANLSRLETFIVQAEENVGLPNTIWNMNKLRHLCMKRIHRPVGFILPTENLENLPDLYHLNTLTLAIDPSSQSLHNILMKLPSIRRLKCVDVTARESAVSCSGNLVFGFMSQLESLQLVGFHGPEFAFPVNLKKLTLSSEMQRSLSEISTIGKLPNLEVLKLRNAFVGETWEMKEGEFPSLVFLGLYGLDIVTWTASCDNFPHLQKLVLHGCRKLEEVPSCLGEIPTIEMITVRWCHKSAVSSVKQIQKEQMEMGNTWLRVIYQED